MCSQSAFPLINTCAFQPQFPGTSMPAALSSACAFRLPSSTSTASTSSITVAPTAGRAVANLTSPALPPPRRKNTVIQMQKQGGGAGSAPPVYDVFLGGSCGNTVWRQDLVIPYLQKRGITYYDPQRPAWSENMIYEEAIAKENSKLFLFVLDPGNINATSFLEIAYLAARKAPRLVVVFLGRREWSDKAHPMDLPDRIRTCDLLEAILTRHSVPMLTSITAALDCVDEMIIGEQSWRSAMTNPAQRLPFLQVKSSRLARKSCRAYKRIMMRIRTRFGVYARRVGVILMVESVVAILLIMFVFNSNVPSWAVLMPILAFDYLGLIIALFYCRFKARHSKEKIGAKLIIAGTPIPRMTESAALIKPPSNSASIPSFPQRASDNEIFPTKMCKQTPLEPSAQIPYSMSLPEDIGTKGGNVCGEAAEEEAEREELLPSGDRFPRRRSSAKSKRKDGTEETDKENVGEIISKKFSTGAQNFARVLADSTALVDAEVRRSGVGTGTQLLQQCSVCSAQSNAGGAPDSAQTPRATPSLLNGHHHPQRRRRRETIATSMLAKSGGASEASALNSVPRTTSICSDAAQWAECQKCLRRERLTLSGCVTSPVGYDVFLSCSSSSELDWITQKAVPQLHKSGLSYTSALMCDKEMRIPMLHTASHILYYIPSYKTFLSGMIEIAYFIGHWDWQVTVCVPREAECLIPLDETNTRAADQRADSAEQRALCAAVERRNECYRMAFCYLKDMAQRRQCRVFTKVEDAIKHIANDKSRSSAASQRCGGARLRQIVEKQHLVKTGPIDVELSRLSLDMADDSSSASSAPKSPDIWLAK